MAEIPRERWSRIEALVDEALELPAEERAAFVRASCGSDEDLRRAVEEWLAACDDPSRFPDTPAAVFAAPLLTTGAGQASGDELSDIHHIGPYSIVRELGRGGMGAVYLAERDDGELSRSVAIKLMRRGTGDDARLRRRFRDERQILSQLEHPNIAGLIDAGVTPDGRLYFVLQYIDGTPLDRYCEDRALPVEARLRIFLNVCAAVQHAHRHQIVHRDLKPGNILVAADGQPKLLDFGIAKLLEPGAQSGEQTRTGERLLTPEYASPEQIRGETVTPASDVHALGVLLHRLLTGQRPFRRASRTPYELERAILDEEPTQPSDVVTDPGERRRLRGDLDAIVLTALRKDPAQRYPDAGQLGADVERHLNGLPVRARGRAPAYRLRAYIGRHRGSVAAVAAGMLLGATLFGVWLARTRSSTGVPGAAGTVLAIGRIVDHRAGASSESAMPLVDMLSTNLARTQGLSVVSAGRMYELAHRASPGDSPGGAFANAARLAGASNLVSGAIYATATGVRLDLRREDVASGKILGAYTASGADLFALADSATHNLVADLHLAAPSGSIADVTTRSLTAYSYYMEGLQAFSEGRVSAADTSFAAALREDSTFAMAAYYYARNSAYEWRFPSATAAGRADFEARLARAMRLAGKASDRERLMIRGYVELYSLTPAMRAVAETLAVRYPQELEGHLLLGVSRVLAGQPREAIVHYSRVVELDSASLRAGADRCAACIAVSSIIEAMVLMDSLAGAEQYARRWLSVQRGAPSARNSLLQVLDAQGRHAEALALIDSGPIAGSTQDSVITVAKHWLRAGDLVAAAALLQTWLRREKGQARAPLLYFQAVTLRNQGRLREALAVARELRSVSGERTIGDAAPPSALVEAQTLLELGRLRDATSLFDSIARWPAPGQQPSARATLRVQSLSMVAASLFAARDTVRLARLADSVEREGQRPSMFRPRDQHHFVRGVLHVARGDDAEGIRAFDRALGGLTSDFGRANLELASIYLRQNRARDAIAALRPASRGWFMETTNLHITLTEVYERLAQAHEKAGAADSALVHWRRVAHSWAQADPQFAARRQVAADRIAALTPRGGT